MTNFVEVLEIGRFAVWDAFCALSTPEMDHLYSWHSPDLWTSRLRDNPGLVNLITAEKWNGVTPTSMVPGSAVPFVSIK